VWINSPGGDCVAAAQIYNMLMDYKGSVTVKIDGIAASAASVIAMAGTKVYVSPVSMLMIHNPMTVAMGNAADMEKAIDMLSSVKDSIINAYELKTGLSRAKISHLMDDETWMDANKAVELGFADEILSRPKLTASKKEEEPAEPEKTEEPGEEEEDQEEPKKASMLFSRKVLEAEFMSKLRSYTAQKPSVPDSTERPVKDIMARLDTIKKFM
jgi:ATP-dependent Clp protease protease subunit